MKLFLVGLGVAFVAGVLYIVYKMQKQNRNDKTEYKAYTSQDTRSKNPDKSITPLENRTGSQNIEALKEECWELYKESFFAEKMMEYYKDAFGGNKILYYTQRIFGELFIDEVTSTKRIVNSIEKIEDMLNILSYNIETGKTDVPSTKESFFANRVVNINYENLRNKIAELEANISRTKKSENYIFYSNLYETTVTKYKELIDLSNSGETAIEQFVLKAKELIDALDKNGIKTVYATDVDEEQKAIMFNSNSGASNMPAFINKTSGQVVSKGNFE